MKDFTAIPDIKNHKFLSGGGEMGARVRAKNWSQTPLGDPEHWPQSLRTMVSVMLDNPFGTYIAWGKEYTQLYNDGYRPILGSTKHPQALGISTRETFEEIWHIVQPMFDGVMRGEAFYRPDFMFQLNRNGFFEDCYFDFSYSPIRKEDGEIGGVLVTVIETTETKKTQNKLKESEKQLQFAIEAAQLGTWDYNPATNKFTANSRLKEWFGLSLETEIDLHHATDTIAEKDRQRILEVIQKTLDFASGGYCEEEFTIIHPVTKTERILLVKGKASFNDDKVAWRLNGTLEDVTKDVIAQRKLEESERSLRLMITQAPVAICVFKGKDHIVEIANSMMLELWGKSEDDVMHKPIFKGLPEAKGQGLEQILDNVFATGEKFQAVERPVNLPRNGKIETAYINFIYEVLRNTDGTVSGVLAVASDVTAQVSARKKIQESEEQLRIALEGGELGTFDFYPETDILIWSAKTKEFFGLPPDAPVNYAIYLQGLHPDYRNISKAIALQQTDLKEGGLYELEYPTMGINDGKLRWIRSKGKTTYNDEGKPIRYTGVTQDITRLKMAEEKIKQFKFMADNASDPFIVTREDGTFAYLNKMALEKWGYTEEEAKHINGPDVDPVYDAALFNKIFDKALHENIPPYETMHKHKNGIVYPVEINMTTLMLDGKPHLFAVARDITERKKAEQALKESEEKFRTMAESSDILIGVNNETVNAVYFNKAWEKLTGRKVEDLINLNWADLLHPHDRQPFLDQFFHAIENKESYAGEFRILNKEGSYSWLYAKVQVRLHPDGSYAGHISSCIDITERKQVEEEIKRSDEALKQSEKRLRSLVESAPFPIGVYAGREMRIELVNDSILHAWGRTRDVVGKLYADVLTELTGQGVYEQLDAVFTTGIPFHANNQYIDLMIDGKLQSYYYNYSFTPLYDQAGKIYGILNTAANVTELNIAKIKLEESEQKLSLVIDASDLGNWEVNLATNEISYSERYLEIFGCAKGTLLTRSDIAKLIHPDDRLTRDNALETAYKTGALHYEARLLWPDNSIHWIEVKGKLFSDKYNNPVRLIGTVRDVTEQKFYQQYLEESEQKFRLLADSMPQFIWTGDSKGNLNYFNKAVFQYSGLSEKDTQNNGWLKIVHPDERDENINRWMHSINTGEDFLFEHRFRRYDGEYRWQLSRAVPQKDETGKIQMWVGTSTDIQEMKEQDQQKDYFISVASHELKTPITSIKGYAQILQSMYISSGDAFLIKSLGIVEKQISKLTKLISDLLDLSKIKSGILSLHKENFQVNEFIEEVIDEIKHINPGNEIAFSKGTNTFLYADRERIGQVLINLLTNAIKYSPPSGKIKVDSLIDNNTLLVCVEDYGIGINEDDQKKIFQRFYRVEGKNEKTYPGFGIGLFISMEIIRKHNGNIGVKSEPGKGSLFYFSIPLSNVD